MKHAAVLLLTLVVLLVAAAALSSDVRKAALTAAMWAEAAVASMERRQVSVGGHEIVYLERTAPNESAEVLLLLHGFTADKGNWPRFVRRIEPRYRVIAPDWPAHGESTYIPDGDYSIAAQAERLEGFLDALDVTSAHLVGNSMGGAIAARFAARHPDRVRTLTLMNAGGADNPETFSRIETAMQSGKNPLLVSRPNEFSKTVRLAMERPPLIPWPVNVAMAEQAAGRYSRFDSVFKQVHEGVTNTDIDYLRRISSPTLVMWGDMDQILDVGNVKVFSSAISNSATVIYPGVGHMPMLEVPARAARDIVSFIQSHQSH